MSSVIFQPLLHDPLGWKPTTTTYSDHFQWRKVRVNRKDKMISPYGQKYLRKKDEDKPKRSSSAVQRTINNEENPVSARVPSSKTTGERQKSSQTQNRPPSSKSAPAVLEESPPVRSKSSVSAHRESLNVSRMSQRSANYQVANDETTRVSPVPERYRSLPEEQIVVFVPPLIEETRHWLNYPIPRTPQHIIDSKVRLGQIKAPALLARSKSAHFSSNEETSTVQPTVERNESIKSTRSQLPKSAEQQRHFFDFNLPQTPDDLRAARYRVDKHRYNSSLDNYPPRPQSILIPVDEETSTAVQSVVVNQTETEVPPEETTTTATVPNANEPSTTEENQNGNQENQTSTILIPINTDNLPKAYGHALDIANEADDRYLKGSKENFENPSEVIVYRLPSRTQEKRSSASRSLRQPTPTLTNTNNALRQQDFNTWVRQATDQERSSAMKILSDVIQQSTTNDEQSSGQRSTHTSQSRSGLRKLGRVRTQPRVSADQNNAWNIPKPIFDRVDPIASFHHVPTSKSSYIQV